MFESRRIKRMNREGLSRQPRNKAFYGNETARWARDAPKKSSSAWLHHRKWKKSATKIYVSPHEGKEVEKRMCVCKFYTRSRKSEPWYVCNVRTRLSDVSNLCALLCTGEIKIFMECTFECCFCAVGFFFFGSFWMFYCRSFSRGGITWGLVVEEIEVQGRRLDVDTEGILIRWKCVHFNNRNI